MGEYWNNQVKIPGKTYVVGNPHFHESIKIYNDIKEEENTILIISQPYIASFFIKIASELSQKLKNFKIIFKLHPGEWRFKGKYDMHFENYNNIFVETDTDIYKLIKKSEYIIGHTSTSLFEAYGFDKKIFVYDDSLSQIYIPKEIGMRFRNVDDLLNNIRNKYSAKNKSVNIDYFFNRNWKENYIRFLKEEINLNL